MKFSMFRDRNSGAENIDLFQSSLHIVVLDAMQVLWIQESTIAKFGIEHYSLASFPSCLSLLMGRVQANLQEVKQENAEKEKARNWYNIVLCI